MKCEQIHPLFSELLEEQLGGDLKVAVKQHLDLCAACRTELGSFASSTHALRTFSVPQTSGEYVQSIMAAIDGARPGGLGDGSEGRRTPPLRRVGSHALSALIGAAGALLLLRLLGPEPTASAPEPTAGEPVRSAEPIVRTQLVEVPARVRRVQGEGSLVRGGRTEMFAAPEDLLFEPGDVYRIADGADLTLALGDSGVVRIEVARTPRPEPPEPQVIEKLVEKTRFVRRGPLVSFELDRELVAQAADRVSRSIDSMRSSLRLVGSTSRGQVNPNSHAAIRQERVAPRSPTPIPLPAVINNVDGRLTLETSGQPFEVLPALIGFLDDPDPDLVEMVLERLESIRQELDADPALSGTLELEPPGLMESRKQGSQDPLTQLKNFFSSAKEPARSSAVSNIQRWSLWWERNAVRILQAETFGTF